MEKYLEILNIMKKEKLDTTKLLLVDIFKYQLEKEELQKAVDFAYELWLKSNVDISLTRLADVVADNWEDIKIGKMSKADITNITLSY